MKWYHYLLAFLAGVFLANAVPHFTHGISGDAFPTPFANPPGKGLSTPTLNVIWASVNLLIGYMLLQLSKASTKNVISMAALFAGIVSISIMLSNAFIDKVKI